MKAARENVCVRDGDDGFKPLAPCLFLFRFSLSLSVRALSHTYALSVYLSTHLFVSPITLRSLSRRLSGPGVSGQEGAGLSQTAA